MFTEDIEKIKAEIAKEEENTDTGSKPGEIRILEAKVDDDGRIIISMPRRSGKVLMPLKNSGMKLLT